MLNYKVSSRNKQNSQIFAYKSFVFPTRQTNVNSNRVGIHFPRFSRVLVHFLFIRIKNIYSAEIVKIFSYNNPIVLANPRKILFHPIEPTTAMQLASKPVYNRVFHRKNEGKKKKKKTITIKIHVENIRP